MKHNKYHNNLIAIIAVCIIAITNKAEAQATKNLSIDEAIKLSVQTSGMLKIANAKITEAIANYHQAWDNQLPDLKTSASYMRLNNPTVNLKLKLGSSSSGAKAPTVNEISYAMVNASLPLFSGFRIKYGMESAKYLEQATKLDAELQKEEVIQNAVNAYCNLYKAQKAVELVHQNLKNQEQRVTDFTNLQKNGVLAMNDLLKAKLQQSNTELALMDAENNLKITCINLCLMLSLPENTQLIADSTAFQTLADAGTINNWEQTALQNRKDIASIGIQAKATETAIKAAKGEYYPGLALTGGYIVANIPGLVSITNAINAGIGVQYNIGTLWKTAAKVDAAKARLVQVQATQGIMADQIRLQINQAYENYLLSVRKIDVYYKAIEQAKENYRLTKNKFNNNLVTTTDLLDADVAQLQAELNYATSKADAFTAYKKLQQTAGTIK